MILAKPVLPFSTANFTQARLTTFLHNVSPELQLLILIFLFFFSLDLILTSFSVVSGFSMPGGKAQGTTC